MLCCFLQMNRMQTWRVTDICIQEVMRQPDRGDVRAMRESVICESVEEASPPDGIFKKRGYCGFRQSDHS